MESKGELGLEGRDLVGTIHRHLLRLRCRYHQWEGVAEGTAGCQVVAGNRRRGKKVVAGSRRRGKKVVVVVEQEEEGRELWEEEAVAMEAAAGEWADKGCCTQSTLCMRFGPWTLLILL